MATGDPETKRVLVANRREFLRFIATPTEMVRAEVCRCVSRLADALKPEYADALRRIEVDGASVKSFAEERGISKSNAGVRVFRAREVLRRQLAATCGACADHGCLSCTCARTAARSVADAGGVR